MWDGYEHSSGVALWLKEYSVYSSIHNPSHPSPINAHHHPPIIHPSSPLMGLMPHFRGIHIIKPLIDGQ